MFRLLLDENLPAQLAVLLRSRGFDVVHAREVGLRSAPDEKVLEHAAAEDRLCLTLDRDLHRLLAETGAESPSVILLRNVQLPPAQVVVLIQGALNQIGEEFTTGFAATVTPKSIRLRRLPISRARPL